MKITASIILLFSCCRVLAATITAASASRADVGTAYTNCSDGDTLAIPAGTAAWTTTLTISKAIKVIGAGTNSSGGTVLQFDADISMFTIDSAAKVNTNMLLASIQFTPGATTAPNRWIAVNGCNTNQTFVIMTNLFFNGNTGLGVFVDGAIGVMSKCKWILTGSSIGCYIWHPNWNGGQISSGSFSTAPGYGTSQAWIIEDCVAVRSSATYAFTDAYQGARYVVRHCLMTNCWLEAHGTESAFTRGTRWMESYFNTFHGDGASAYVHNFRSGTGIIWSNTVVNVPSAANFAQLSAYRAVMQASPWGQAHGLNPADVNDSTRYDAGRATSGGALMLIDNTKNWTPNQWIGYSLLRTNPITSGYTTNTDFRGGYILTNNATTIVVSANIGGAFPDISFATSDDYEIRKVTESLDQPGAGSDDVELNFRLLDAVTVSANVATATLTSHGFSTGNPIIMGSLQIGSTSDISVLSQVTVVNSSTFTFPLFTADGSNHPVYRGLIAKVSNAQTLDPCYEWGNTVNGSNADFAAAEVFIRVNEHYYNDTVKPGYTPYTYPHPLVSGAIVNAFVLNGLSTIKGATLQ